MGENEMRKQMIALLAGAMLMMALIGTASALTFTSTTELNYLLSGTGTKTWIQAMPGDFEIPYDTVNSATLTINAYAVDGNNDKIYVENSFQGALVTGIWSWNNLLAASSTKFDVASTIIAPWPTGSSLDVSLKYNEKGFFNALLLCNSVLTLDYTNKTSPVPEPGTMMLLGLGMLGMAIYGKRRMNKEA